MNFDFEGIEELKRGYCFQKKIIQLKLREKKVRDGHQIKNFLKMAALLCSE